jgi:hypothetical protein
MKTQFEQWTSVRDMWEDIDLYSEENWHSLALGFFLGLGLSIEDAKDSVRIADKQGLI